MKVMRIFVFGLFAPLIIAACASAPVTDSALVTESHHMIKVQNRLIDEQTSRLDELSDSQSDMSAQIALVQKQVDRISSSIASAIKRSQPNVGDKRKDTVPSQSKEAQANSNATVFDGKAVLGRVEYVWLSEAQEYLKARIDTGAKSSSLFAKNVQPFERDGEPWVRFDMVVDDSTVAMEAPLARYVRIRQSSAGDADRRAVVKLTVNLGELKEETEFTLSDRGEMLYPMLVGRSFLQDIAVVDVAKKFTRSRDPKLTAQVDQ